jgi:prephenate dehydratase
MRSIAYLGPSGTNSETVALYYLETVLKEPNIAMKHYPSIAKVMVALDQKEVDLAVVPVENSTEGGIAITLDGLWEFDSLHIKQELVLPISHLLLSCADSLEKINLVYSHPQALAQCQKWLESNLPHAQIIPTNSTTEALHSIKEKNTTAAISSARAAKVYELPIIAKNINDYPENCTRFWVLNRQTTLSQGNYISLGFSVAENVSGALVKPLQALAKRKLNLSRIESRPTKRSLGEYIFFLDLEAPQNEKETQLALEELSKYTEVVRIFGRYEAIVL